MNTVKKIRSDIMEILFKIDDIKILESIRYQLKKSSKIEKEENISFMDAVKPIRKNVSLEMLMIEQDYKPITYQKFREKVDKIEWNESLEELLDALN